MATSSEPPLPGFVATQLKLSDKGTDKNRCAVKTLTQARRRLDPRRTSTTTAIDGCSSRSTPAPTSTAWRASCGAMARMDRVILCMGAPKPGFDLNVPHRRLWAQSDPLENTMIAVPRAWLPVDVDDAVVPARARRPGAVCRRRDPCARHLLPEEFRGATMVVSPSAHTGLRGPTLLRCRLWFLLDRVHELSALNDWTRGLKTIVGVGDSAIIQAAQPIYVWPRPVRRNDRPDPADAVGGGGSRITGSRLAGRRSLRAESRRRSTTSLVSPRSPAATTGRRSSPRRSAAISGSSSRCPRGSGLAARSNDTDDAIIAFTLALLAKRADRGRIAQYDKAWIARTLTRFRAMDGRVQAARAAACAASFTESERRQ